MKFKVGDKVRCIDREPNGKIGVIVKAEGIIGVDFGKDFKGHTLRGRLKTHTGWWCADNILVPIKMMVYRKGE